MRPPRALTFCASPTQAVAFVRWLAVRGVAARAEGVRVIGVGCSMSRLNEMWDAFAREEAAKELAG